MTHHEALLKHLFQKMSGHSALSTAVGGRIKHADNVERSTIVSPYISYSLAPDRVRTYIGNQYKTRIIPFQIDIRMAAGASLMTAWSIHGLVLEAVQVMGLQIDTAPNPDQYFDIYKPQMYSSWEQIDERPDDVYPNVIALGEARVVLR